jgi:excisionase family DNA binding protein
VKTHIAEHQPVPRHAVTVNADELYLTVSEACKLAKFSRNTFYRLLDDRSSGLDRVIVRVPVVNHIRVPKNRFCLWLEGRLKE